MRSEVWAGRREGVGRRQRTRGMHEERAQLWRHPVPARCLTPLQSF